MKLKFLIPILFLSACISQPPQSLDDKLAGKSSKEKHEVLRLACLNEAEDLGEPDDDIRNVHGVKLNKETEDTRRLKDICRQMAKDALTHK